VDFQRNIIILVTRPPHPANDTTHATNDKDKKMSSKPPPSSASKRHSILRLPPPIKRLFDSFPLVIYPPNELPARSVTVPTRAARADIHAFYDAHVTRRRSSAGYQKENALHGFFSWACEGDESPNVGSFHPGCLRWQVSGFCLFGGSGMMRIEVCCLVG
jgi:hypothetical protein